MKVKTLVENVPGSLNRRYFCEIEQNNVTLIKREGNSMKEAAVAALYALRYMAGDAERVLREMGVLT